MPPVTKINGTIKNRILNRKKWNSYVRNSIWIFETDFTESSVKPVSASTSHMTVCLGKSRGSKTFRSNGDVAG